MYKQEIKIESDSESNIIAKNIIQTESSLMVEQAAHDPQTGKFDSSLSDNTIKKKAKSLFRESWDTFKFEISYNLEIFKEKSFYLYLFAVLALVLVLFKQYIYAVFCLFILIILKFKFDHDTGIVKSFVRRKEGIPSRSDIVKMKNENKSI